MKWIASLFCLACAASALAETSKPQVIFFGGWGATAADMKSWEDGVRASRQYGDRYSFTGVPYPGGGHQEGQVLRAGQGLIKKYVEMIRANPNQEFILVAHSSSGELVNAIGKQIPKSSRVKVVLLDTFNAATPVQDKFPTICYSASSSMSSCRNRIAFSPQGCAAGRAGSMCRHFKMVNQAMGAQGDVASGYSNFNPYLSWLDQSRDPVPAMADTGGGGSGSR